MSGRWRRGNTPRRWGVAVLDWLGRHPLGTMRAFITLYTTLMLSLTYSFTVNFTTMWNAHTVPWSILVATWLALAAKMIWVPEVLRTLCALVQEYRELRLEPDDDA